MLYLFWAYLVPPSSVIDILGEQKEHRMLTFDGNLLLPHAGKPPKRRRQPRQEAENDDDDDDDQEAADLEHTSAGAEGA
eukprot:778752-Pelagomonas_calceolata.AAC.4